MYTWAAFDILLRGGGIGIQLLLIIILWRDHRHTPAGRIAIAFLIAVICHLLATARGTAASPLSWGWLAELGSNASPGLFWLMACAWFGDERPGWRSWAIVGVSMGLMQLHGLVMISGYGEWYYPTGGAARLVAATLAGMALYVAWRGRNDDLIEERRRLRVKGIGAIGVYTILVLTVEIGMRPNMAFEPGTARTWLVGGIFILTLAAASQILTTNRADLFGSPKLAGDEDDTGPAAVDPELAAKLDGHMTRELAWREDGLAIAELARRLGTQEYRLRRLINRQLGHRNFAGFLNSYRLEEVRSALADPEQRDVPILTIALDAGFGSLGPFNRAFRDAENMTPSQYRTAKL